MWFRSPYVSMNFVDTPRLFPCAARLTSSSGPALETNPALKTPPTILSAPENRSADGAYFRVIS